MKKMACMSSLMERFLLNQVGQVVALKRGIATLLCCIFLSSFAWGKNFTLSQIMSSPFPSSMSAAPSGGAVAWVQNTNGIRNIWVAHPPEYQGRMLTAFNQDDGQLISELTWTSDAQQLIYVKGDRVNRKGASPNPINDPSGTSQEIWRVSLSDRQPVKIAKGNSPTVSQVGHGLAFVAAGNIHYVDLSLSQPVAKRLIKNQGFSSQLRWSPNGNKLAFVSRRNDYSFIGVYNLNTKSVQYLTPGVDSDQYPVWSPDGSKIAFLRRVNGRIRPFQIKRELSPWSILVSDLSTGKETTVFTADKGVGSVFRKITAKNQLFWDNSDHLIFPWEKTGWNLLYAISAKGGKPQLLTSGEFEVEYVAISPDKKSIYYNSNQNDIDSRDLWQVAVSGGKPKQITQQEGVEWHPTPLSNGRDLAFFMSSDTTPAMAAVRVNNKQRALAPASLPNDFPSHQLVTPQVVSITSADGMKIPGQLFLPNDRVKGKKYPALVYLHGGSRRQMLPAWHYMEYYHNAYSFNQFLANQGYIVLSVNFRSGTGYGMEFREALYYGTAGASEFNDVLGAGLYLKNRPDVATDQIGLWGGSYGGNLTAMGLAKASNLFAAGVDIHGVHDWNASIKNFMPSYNPMKQPEVAQVATLSSPMFWLDTWRSPVLLISGDDDRNVNFRQSITLARELRRRDVEVETLVFPGEVHFFLLHETWMATFEAAFDFFERKLRSK